MLKDGMYVFVKRLRKVSGALALAAMLQASAASAAKSTPIEPFAACLDKLRTRALAEGLKPTTVDTVFDRITPLRTVVSSDRNQAEFNQTFQQYYDARVNATRVKTGRRQMREHAQALRGITGKYGVPGHYIMALWGLETNFGGYMGKLSAPSALATLACDGRRAEFFSAELLAATRLVERGDVTLDTMLGSWAGALGHVQFMPSTYLRHAVDGDGDNRRDLYGSLPDAFASAASYLSAIGWQPGLRWGREVHLPDNFDYAKTGPDQWQPLADWRALGVTDAFGRLLPDLALPAALLLPSGHRGPAFLVYDNFRVIMQWNRSTNYAIAVGRLADRIAGAGRLSKSHPTLGEVRFSLADIAQLQTYLNAAGFDSGTPDGILGRGTRRALQRYQQAKGLLADGYPDAPLIARAKDAQSESVGDDS
ncbi:MAG: lytic murein transglycosylase [Pseudomonadota bacterium]